MGFQRGPHRGLPVLCDQPGEHEANALRVWDGDGAVRCLATRSLESTTALLLERCVPACSSSARCRSPSRTL